MSEGIRLPADIAVIRQNNPARALALQAEMATQFEDAFARRLTVIGVERDDTWFTYLLGESS